MAKHLDTTKPVDGATWAHKPYVKHTPGRHAPFFDGANLGHRMALRFDALSWASHSLQNPPSHNID